MAEKALERAEARRQRALAEEQMRQDHEIGKTFPQVEIKGRYGSFS